MRARRKQFVHCPARTSNSCPVRSYHSVTTRFIPALGYRLLFWTRSILDLQPTYTVLLLFGYAFETRMSVVSRAHFQDLGPNHTFPLHAMLEVPSFLQQTCSSHSGDHRGDIRCDMPCMWAASCPSRPLVYAELLGVSRDDPTQHSQE